jgi:hypothetical protein
LGKSGKGKLRFAHPVFRRDGEAGGGGGGGKGGAAPYSITLSYVKYPFATTHRFTQ